MLLIKQQSRPCKYGYVSCCKPRYCGPRRLGQRLNNPHDERNNASCKRSTDATYSQTIRCTAVPPVSGRAYGVPALRSKEFTSGRFCKETDRLATESSGLQGN